MQATERLPWIPAFAGMMTISNDFALVEPLPMAEAAEIGFGDPHRDRKSVV